MSNSFFKEIPERKASKLKKQGNIIIPDDIYLFFPELSTSETETIFLLSVGLTLKEIADCKNLSEGTIRKYLNCIKEKTQANTSNQLRMIFISRLLTHFLIKI